MHRQGGDSYAQGHVDHAEGVMRNANPYAPDTELAELWSAGWDEAEAERNETKTGSKSQ